MIVGALVITNVHVMDTSADAFCPVEGCFGMALKKVEIAGYPAGFVCARHGSEWAKLWRELIEDGDDLAVAA